MLYKAHEGVRVHKLLHEIFVLLLDVLKERFPYELVALNVFSVKVLINLGHVELCAP